MIYGLELCSNCGLWKSVYAENWRWFYILKNWIQFPSWIISYCKKKLISSNFILNFIYKKIDWINFGYKYTKSGTHILRTGETSPRPRKPPRIPPHTGCFPSTPRSLSHTSRFCVILSRPRFRRSSFQYRFSNFGIRCGNSIGKNQWKFDWKCVPRGALATHFISFVLCIDFVINLSKKKNFFISQLATLYNVNLISNSLSFVIELIQKWIFKIALQR